MAYILLFIIVTVCIAGEEGDKCYAHGQCKTGCCYSGICKSDTTLCPNKTLGNPCNNDFECMAYQCSTICINSVNQTCTSHSDCHNKCCKEGTCQYNSTIDKCSFLVVGQNCTSSFECINYQCSGNRCLAELGGECKNHKSCSSKCCYNSKCNDTKCSVNKLSLGMECGSHYECDSYSCNTVCVAQENEYCNNHISCETDCCYNNICQSNCNLLSAGNSCFYNYQCKSYLCRENKCAAELGSLCSSHGECISNCCYGYCLDPNGRCLQLEVGSSCNHSGNCLNYICKDGKCLGVDGSSCNKHSDCQQECCVNGACCSDVSLCPKKEPGETCNGHYECSSYKCELQICKGNVNDHCNNHLSCQTKCCMDDSKCYEPNNCKNYLQGEPCSSNFECQSYNCFENYCVVQVGDQCNGHRQCESQCCKNYQCQNSEQNCLRVIEGGQCDGKDSCKSYICKNNFCVNAINKSCSNHTHCESQCCSIGGNCISETHCSRLAAGSKCESNQECVSYICGDNGVCQLSNDAKCTNHSQCVSGCCYKVEGQLPYCAPSNVCNGKMTGDDCVYDNDCLNFYCDMNNKCADYVGKSCSHHGNCFYGCCDENQICSIDICPQKPYLFGCTSNYECKSYICKDHKCLKRLYDKCFGHDNCITGCCFEDVCNRNVTEYCPYLERGAYCTTNSDCKSHLCSPLHKCMAFDGEECNKHNECNSSCCNQTSTPHTCTSECNLLPPNSNCNNHYECQSDICNSGLCKANIGENCSNHPMCNLTVCYEDKCSDKKIDKLPIGSACNKNWQCESYICSDYICKINNDDNCSNHSYCKSGCCYDGRCKESECPNKPSGAICQTNFECQNYDCVKDEKISYCKGMLPNCTNHRDCPLNICCGNSGQCRSQDELPYCNKVPEESCDSNEMCESYQCVNGYCVGLPCKNHTECVTHCCGQESICSYIDGCPSIRNGDPCKESYECQSYNCTNKICSDSFRYRAITLLALFAIIYIVVL